MNNSQDIYIYIYVYGSWEYISRCHMKQHVSACRFLNTFT